ncbi:MAG: hypothetical protein ACOZNI_12150 [Myxococcota bacterium]
MLALLGCHPDPESILGPDPEARYEVRAYALAGDVWSPGAVVAHGFSSLHAVEWDGALVVPGLRAEPPTAWEERFPSLFVDALVTTDGETWTVRRHEVDAPGRSLLDPAIVTGPDGVALWFVRADGVGDPATRRTEIVRARWDGERFGDAEVWHAGEGLVDPSPVWRDGTWEVLATKGARDVVALPEGRAVLGGATVPFAMGDTVLAQRGHRPVLVVGGAEETVPIAIPEGETCASPVAGTVAGRSLLLCVNERGSGHPSPPTPLPAPRGEGSAAAGR